MIKSGLSSIPDVMQGLSWSFLDNLGQLACMTALKASFIIILSLKYLSEGYVIGTLAKLVPEGLLEYSRKRAMSYVFRRATVRLSPVLRAGAPQACRLHQPSLWKCEPAVQPFRRNYSRNTRRQEDDADEKAKELHEQAVAREERKVTSGTSAQSKENDRPWQRMSSHAQPESTSPDPAKGDATKGKTATNSTEDHRDMS